MGGDVANEGDQVVLEGGDLMNKIGGGVRAP